VGYYITFDGGSGTGKGTVIKEFENYLTGLGKKVKILRDNEIAPLRDHGALMLPWCGKNDIVKSAFVFPLFVAGFRMTEQVVDEALRLNDFVLRDRSFVSSLAYRASPGDLDQYQIWDLFINHMGLRVPDIAVITDCDVDTAMERESLRKQADKGLGGKMSGGRGNRVKIRELFLKLPEVFDGKMNVVIVRNGGKFTDDKDAVARKIAKAADKMITTMKRKGIKI